jgi:ABC-2 type transport system ATP-binding protein
MTLISARELSKHYPGVHALDGLTLDLEPGIIGFVGANGAGKSTFIRILLGLLLPTSGTVSVLGFDTRANPLEIRRLVGYMPEHDCLPLDISGTDFVSHMGQMSGLLFTAARERAAEMLRHVGLHEERYRLIGSYSTGMKQRIKLAQALVHDPRLLLLDEPTNGLDPEGREEMLMLVERTGRDFGIAVMVTSHLLGEIERVCNWLVAIDAGRLQYSGSVSAFTERTQRLRLELDDDVPEFAAALRARGLAVTEEGTELHVGVPEEWVFDVVRDVAAELGAPLSRMEVTRHRLEDLFRTAAPEVMPEVPHG